MLPRAFYSAVLAHASSALSVLVVLGCQNGPVPPEERVRAAPSEAAEVTPAAARTPPRVEAPPQAIGDAVPVAAPPLAGITWEPPVGFSSVPPANSMRAAEYVSVDGAARLSVFHFPGMRESVQANIERWKQQFDEAARERSRVETREVAGLSVTTLDIEGENAGMHVPGSEGSDAPRPRERMVGVAVVAPGGVVFFKLIGPSAAVGGVRADMDVMIATLRPVAAQAGGGE